MASAAARGKRPNKQTRTTSGDQQQTISHLFSSSQVKSSPFIAPQTPDRKRKRPETPDPSPVKSTSISDMYNFTTKPNSNGVVDLVSPNGSPQRTKQRRISVSAKVENAPSPLGPKRLAVKNFRAAPKSDSSQYVTKTTQQLDDAITAIFADKRPQQSNEELYKGCENLCKLGRASELTRTLKDQCKTHIATLKEDFRGITDGKDSLVLNAVLAAWRLWTRQVNAIRGIFFYLDRSHLLQTQGGSIHDISIALFRKHIFGDAAVQGKVIEGTGELLLADRRGTSSDSQTFDAAIKMFHELGVYTTNFEPHMLAASQSYVHDWSDKMISNESLPVYVSSAVALMDQEMKRCDEFDLDRSTGNELLTLLEDHLIQRRAPELANMDAVADELDKPTSSATPSLKSLFELMQRRRLGVKLKEPFSKWIDDTGTSIVFDEKEQDKMVIRLLELKQKIDHIWRFAFAKHEEIGHALRSSFEAFMNKSKKSSATWNTDNSRTGEMIAKYVDMLLKAGAKAIPTNLKIADGAKPGRAFKRFDEDNEPAENGEAADEDAEVDNQLDQVLDLFRFVHGKAVFEAFYKKDLARRLLMGRSASHDAEKNMLARLKTECGAGFTHNLEQMFKDIELADEEAKAYKNRQSGRSSAPTIDLSVNILSTAAWPTYPDAPIAIPPALQTCIADFERFYYLKHSGRKLSWKHGLAHCQMSAHFPKGKKELVVSAYQAIILLLFNDLPESEHLSYAHIKSSTNLTDADVQRTLQSLACAKLRPLTKHPRGRDVNITDTFTLTTSFSDPRYRLKINQIQLRETVAENKETHVRVAADRQFETQAAIVRIMKTKKKMGHAVLVGEVISATRSRGVLQPAEIKREIDKLVEKEYLERGEGGLYEYLA